MTVKQAELSGFCFGVNLVAESFTQLQSFSTEESQQALLYFFLGNLSVGAWHYSDSLEQAVAIPETILEVLTARGLEQNFLDDTCKLRLPLDSWLKYGSVALNLGRMFDAKRLPTCPLSLEVEDDK